MPYGVSNSFKRGTMRTYGGRLNRSLLDTNSDRPRTRICMDENGYVKEEILSSSGIPQPPAQVPGKESTEPSSPASRALFSEAEQTTESLSPPSSPPLRRASPQLKTRKPTFNYLKRKRSSTNDVDGAEPLSETNANSARHRQPVKRTRLTQMTIDLGGDVRRTCKDCGMEYVPSNREDATLHKEFHAMNLGGVDMGSGFHKDARFVESWGFGEVVVAVEAKSSLSLRRRTKRVLDVVKADLGAVEISEEGLWGAKELVNVKKNGLKKEPVTSDGSTPDEKQDRYKAFMYLAGDKCVGLCLAERIRHASKVIAHDKNNTDAEVRPGARSSCIRTESSIEPMLLGISRVWISKSHRRKRIAETLLDSARANFFYGIEVPKKMVAFSQPTESGGLLAEHWYGEEAGWHVYSESH